MKLRSLGILLGVCLLTTAILVPQSAKSDSKKTKAAPVLQNVQDGGLEIGLAGRMSFGPNGLLLVADTGNGSVVAIDTGDSGPVKKLKKKVDKIDDLVAAAMGAQAGGVKIEDMAVNPKSGKIYLSVNRKDRVSAILVINDEGKISNLNLKSAKHVRVGLPNGEGKLGNITGVQFAGDRVLAAGQSREEFANKIYVLPLPLKHGDSAAIYSARTYHVAHRRWETKAPIQSFVPYEEDGKNYIVGAFACTPIARFPVDDLAEDAKVIGESVVELGSGNRPVDMFTYKKDGKTWLVTNTDRFHYKRNTYGPSRYWGVRVPVDLLGTDEINENAVRRNTKTKKGPANIEIVDVLSGVRYVDKLNDGEIIVLRDNEGKLDLELAQLP